MYIAIAVAAILIFMVVMPTKSSFGVNATSTLAGEHMGPPLRMNDQAPYIEQFCTDNAWGRLKGKVGQFSNTLQRRMGMGSAGATTGPSVPGEGYTTDSCVGTFDCTMSDFTPGARENYVARVPNTHETYLSRVPLTHEKYLSRVPNTHETYLSRVPLTHEGYASVPLRVPWANENYVSGPPLRVPPAWGRYASNVAAGPY
jgi:hypothetical protein